jgi:hypothetical protein
MVVAVQRVVPRGGFIIGDHHCARPGPEPHLICLADKGQVGEHAWWDWRGCRVRAEGFGMLPFGGFAS